MSSDADEIKFSQESLSLLFTGGATGVSLEHHIPTTSLYSPDPNFDTSLPRTTSMSSFTSTPYLRAIPGPSQPTVIPIHVTQDQEIRTDNMQGSYGFDLKFEERKEFPKNHPCCYSRVKDALIVKDHTAIPFTFQSSYSMRDFRIRITAVFTSKDNFNIPVLPCNNHSGSSQGPPREFVSCNNSNAVDFKDDERHHILLPLVHCRDVSGNGTEMIENFQFNCRSSCTMKSGNKGINNRALSLIFQLETDHGVPLGRRVVSLKVAVSPGRDIMTLINAEGKRGRKRSRTQSEVAESSSGAASGPSAGKTSPKESKKRAKAKSMSGNHKYTVVVNGLELRDRLQVVANSTDAKYNGTSETGKEWAEYLGDEPCTQTSVGTQENGSQPDQYSLEGWLSRYGLECYTEQLEEAGFGSPSNFQCVQESDLDKLEIFDKCHRLTILHAAKRILIRGVANIVKGEC